MSLTIKLPLPILKNIFSLVRVFELSSHLRKKLFRSIYTMQVIYDHLLPTLFDDSKVELLSKEHLEVSLTGIRERLQELFNSSETNYQENNIPKLDWIRDAFDRFVEIELAKRIDSDKYLVKIPRSKEDTIEFLARKMYKYRNKRRVFKSESNPTLFD
ncbi:hypothetical protein LJE86_08370 [bacterium BMS3Abin03]|nr:hypothetical protein [bacterium BMS3Abin03]